MTLIATDVQADLAAMLDGFDVPAILVSADYQILATNHHYRDSFGEIDYKQAPRCYRVSHGYDVPCDQAGESCPLNAARVSGSKERVLHIHQTPRGREHVDVEMLPIKPPMAASSILLNCSNRYPSPVLKSARRTW
jgi:hypothetical protein